ncbi:hypothetical protein N7509_000444 [Penicillium cosmopolitanum]|uniref:6-methylsalicylate decarboxylase n=1 Tax=Penicillium cosmopolitanum TaxID=1131564 RepID=A0A9W9WAR9_9EURO|nr:uncharacterized protein N7509_000444 [Penicillium cosmopolitanum]KAJ5413817.1 hypothetical protein N7509_000444 [Penicillium cosmopolitanum]
MPPINTRTKIDTHHHFVPEFYNKAVQNAGGDPSGFPTPQWSPESDEASMEVNGTRTAILSVTAPGPVIAGNDQDARELARECNNYAASLRDQNPTQWGFFAAMPSLLDTEGTLAEIRYALDVLKADGVTLFTRYGPKNQYLGHPAFDPIWQELNSRCAVVFIHPTHPIDPHRVNEIFAQSTVDYPHETTRTAVDLISSGTKRKYPDCKVILSHAGGTLPWLISRVTPSLRGLPFDANAGPKSYEEWIEDFRSFYYDLALSSSPLILTALLGSVPHDHILYGELPILADRLLFELYLLTFLGSDSPYAPAEKIARFKEDLDNFPMDQDLKDKIFFKNALALLPRLDK